MTFTPASEASAPSTFAPVSMRTFCFLISRAPAFAISGSSSGRIWSSASSSVTSVPSRPSAEAISVPDAPAPITHSFFGCSFSSHIAGGVEDALAELEVEDRLGHGADGEDHAVGLDLGAVELAADLHVGVVGDRAEALDQVDLVLVEQHRSRRS